jgi:hypothetical protein
MVIVIPPTYLWRQKEADHQILQCHRGEVRLSSSLLYNTVVVDCDRLTYGFDRETRRRVIYRAGQSHCRAYGNLPLITVKPDTMATHERRRRSDGY